LRIYFACEGKSEERCIDSILLNPGLRFREIGIESRTLNLGGSQGFLKRIGHTVKSAIMQSRADVVFGLTDLHGAAIQLPGDGASKGKKAEVYRNHIHQKADQEYHERFFPHVAVHELEAWILADRDALNAPGVEEIANPEDVNLENPPSKRLDDIFFEHQMRPYSKGNDQSLLWKEVDVRKVYARCPHFAAFLNDLAKVVGLNGPFHV